jgi:hypothetical protein
MDGSSIDLIVIPIVAVISLAAWLIAVAYAAAHPQWKKAAAAGDGSTELASTAGHGSVRDLGLARSSEGHARDEHVGPIAA